jgi:ketosteroid isomerase-like protein
MWLRYNPVMGKDAALVERLLDAFARKDADAVAGMIADDFLFEPLSTEAADRGAYRGGEGMRTYLRDLADTWRQFDVSIDSVQEVDGRVLVTGRIYARARDSSLVADDPVAFAWKVVDGRASWGKVFLSEAAAREAINAT